MRVVGKLNEEDFNNINNFYVKSITTQGKMEKIVICCISYNEVKFNETIKFILTGLEANLSTSISVLLSMFYLSSRYLPYRDKVRG